MSAVDAFGLVAGNLPVAMTLEAVASAATKIRRESQFLEDRLTQSHNPTGDLQTVMDLRATGLLKEALAETGQVANFYSEENLSGPMRISTSRHAGLSVLCDPWDASKNGPLAWPTGSIVGIFEGTELNQAACRMVASALVFYASKTVFAFACAEGLPRILDLTEDGKFRFPASSPDLQIAAVGRYAAIGGELSMLPNGYLLELQNSGMKVRSCGCLAGDILYCIRNPDGGIFLYPRPKLRTLFEILPVGFLMKRAGGLAFAFVNNEPTELEHITDLTETSQAGFICGSPKSVMSALPFFHSAIQQFAE